MLVEHNLPLRCQATACVARQRCLQMHLIGCRLRDVIKRREFALLDVAASVRGKLWICAVSAAT